MLTLSRAVLLMRMKTRNKMGNTHMLGKEVQFLILASPISLYCKDFLIKKSFNMMLFNMTLKVTEFLKHISFFFKR
jgi:hypothetical protein